MTRDPFSGTIPELMHRQALARPTAVAWRCRVGEKRWASMTWAPWWAEVQAVRASFHERGLRRGDRLAILAPTCPRWHTAEMAGLSLGAVVVGLDPQASGEQTAALLKQAQPRALIVAAPADLTRVPTELKSRLRFVAVLQDVDLPGNRALSWQDLCTLGTRPGSDLPGPVADDPAAMIYTSGTTGTAKAIVYSHRQLLVACAAMVESYPQFQTGDVALCWLPLAHLFQRLLNLAAMARGMTLAFVEDPRAIVAGIREAQPALVPVVPRFLEKVHEEMRARLARLAGWRRWLLDCALTAGAARARCLRLGGRPALALRCRHALLDWLVLRRLREAFGQRLRFLLNGSAPAAPALLDFFQQIGVLVLEAYGVSENTVPVAANRPEAYRFGSVGRPFAPNVVRLEVDGKVAVKGPGLFHGYDADEETTQRHTTDGFYLTGDLGRLDADGFLYLLGRKTDIIKTSTGRRIAPARVEALYRRCPHVDQVVVFGNGRPHLVALVTLNAQTPAAAADIYDLIRREFDALGAPLASFERVCRFVFLPQPFRVATGELTPSLKLRRQEIEARYRQTIDRLYDEDCTSFVPKHRPTEELESRWSAS